MSSNNNKITSDVITYTNDSAPIMRSEDNTSRTVTRLSPNSHRIDDILGRYVIMPKATWSSSQGPGEILRSYVLPDDLFIRSQNLRDKLTRYTYLRADFDVLLTVNPSAFHQGKLWVMFDPLGNDVGRRGFKGVNLTRATGFPGVKWDIATGAPCQFHIPYRAPLDAIDLVDGKFDLGNLHLVVFGSLDTISDESNTSLDVKVQIKMSNIELYGPTDKPLSERYFPSPFSAHSNGTPYDEIDHEADDESERARPRPRRRNRRRRCCNDNILKSVATLLRCCSTPVRGCKAHTNEGPSAEENKKSAAGIISGPAAVVNSVASALEPVPIIGEVAGVVAWASRIVGGVAATFGFNKEDSLASSSLYENLPAARYTNADGLTNSVKLGMLPDNRITDMTRFGTASDEMDIGYIGSVPQFVERYSIDIDDDAGTLVCALPVTPAMCSATTNLTTSYQITNLGYVAAQHKFWAGTMNYAFEITKTDLHSLRLRFTYIPGSNIMEITDSLVKDISQFPSSFSQVVEFKKENSSFAISVPFQQNRAVLPVKVGCMGAKDLADDVTYRAKCHNGWIVVTIENPLVRASTVSKTVQFHVSTGCGEDMKFFDPVSGYITPNTMPTRVPYQDKRDKTIYAHTFDQEETEEIIDPRKTSFGSIIGDASPTKRVDTNVGQRVFGEEYINLRQLTRRFTDLTYYRTRDTGDRIQPSISPNGWFLDMADFNAVPTPNLVLTNPQDWIRSPERNGMAATSQMRLLSFMYRGFIGSRRYHIEANNMVSSRPYRIKAATTEEYSILPINEVTQFEDNPAFRSQEVYTNSVFEHSQDGSMNNVLQVTVPYKRTANFSLITDELPLVENPRPYLYCDVNPHNVTDRFTIKIREAAGDDFTFGMMVGVPSVEIVDSGYSPKVDELATYCFVLGDWANASTNPIKGQTFLSTASQGLVPIGTYVLITDINSTHVTLAFKDTLGNPRSGNFTHATAEKFLEYYYYDPNILPSPTPVSELTDIRSALHALSFRVNNTNYVFSEVTDAGKIVYKDNNNNKITYPKLSEFLSTIQSSSYILNDIEYVAFIEDQYLNMSIIGSTFLGYTVIDFNQDTAKYTLNGGISHGLNVIISNVRSGTYHDWVGPEHWIMQAWLDNHNSK